MESSLDTPATLKGGLRVAAVITKHVGNATEATKKVRQLGDEEIKAAEERNTAVSKIGEAVKAYAQERSRWGGLGRLFGKGKRQKEEVDSTFDKAVKTFRKVDEIGTAQHKALSTAGHEIEVAKANTLGGPLESSSKLTESLASQDLISRSKGQ